MKAWIRGCDGVRRGHGGPGRIAICHSCWHDGGSCGGSELGWDLLGGWADVVLASLGGQHSLCLISMSLALAVLLVRVLYGDLLVHEILPVHVGDSCIGRFKFGE